MNCTHVPRCAVPGCTEPEYLRMLREEGPVSLCRSHVLSWIQSAHHRHQAETTHDPSCELGPALQVHAIRSRRISSQRRLRIMAMVRRALGIERRAHD